MKDLFIHERVQLVGQGIQRFPHLNGLVGNVNDERRHPYWGRGYIVRFQVEGRPEWVHVPALELDSLEVKVDKTQPIRAISLWQPWASLVAWGEKQYETRHWSTNYRGLLAIHAAKRKPTSNDVWFMKETLYRVIEKYTALHPEYYLYNEMPRGAVLCIVNLVDVIPTVDPPVENIERLGLSQQEFMFGNYQPNRYLWKLELVEQFAKPVPAKGGQGFWQWSRTS